ncbi:hypothetical protein [Pseudomonas sessilinigenes]|uniref:Leucine-rich repeat domain-containing protein n=1 Tax=Pseudomonas sessilinigenes TaxID=658629 RepID=A0ABX8MJU5_9PSED|nr:hypothetical protein [Pseudomonas sessilinigenes]AZC27424.1 hypothetical protein C4K39_5784 [Pseudomonas sessilinigenes]QXH38670.1 hypothetical protein KSS89_20670 [Pseudomonas sessilinigenes]
MFPHRVKAPTQANLRLQVGARLEADPRVRVIIQWHSVEQYDCQLLEQIDALCARYGERITVRFYNHYSSRGFDGRTLLALPNVHSLSLDGLETLDHFQAIGSLHQLRELALEVFRADMPGLLALPNLERLHSLRLSLEQGPAIDLAPIARMLELHCLHINPKGHGLEILRQCPSISALSLHRLPAKTTLGMVADMSGLRSLSVAFSSREQMPELHSPYVRELEIRRVRGLNRLDLDSFPQLDVLKIEDQAQLSRLDLGGAPQLRKMSLINLKTLGELSGLKTSNITDLRIIRTPELDVLTLIDNQLPPGMQYLNLLSGKHTVDKQIEARQLQLGIPQPGGPF